MPAMDDPRWLRIVVVGLILAILAVVYFLITGGFSSNRSKNTQTQNTQPNKIVVVSPSPTPIPVVTMSPQPQRTATPSAYNSISSRAQGSTQALPNTGFPIAVAVVISGSAVGLGLAFRKFPR